MAALHNTPDKRDCVNFICMEEQATQQIYCVVPLKKPPPQEVHTGGVLPGRATLESAWGDMGHLCFSPSPYSSQDV